MGFSRVFAFIGPELEEVRRRVTHELRRKGTPYIALVEQELATPASRLHPALVIISAKFFHYHPPPVLALACVIQFIYLATRIHFSPGERPALSVLLGDLLYSKFFSYLCRHHCLEFLAPLAEVISRIHEGGAMRRTGVSMQYPECMDLIDREAALLLREACRTGARVAGAPPEDVEVLADFGLNLGRGWGLLREKVPTKAWKYFLDRARKSLELLPVRPEREMLSALLDAVAALTPEPGGVTAG